jgi:hypothetical protein
MSYEYSSTSQNFDLPNPYRVQNLFTALASAAALLLGLILLIILRQHLSESPHSGALVATGVAVLMIAAGLGGLSLVAMQLRFFFGRGRPASLAAEVNAQQGGQGAGSAELREMLRQNALSYAEPRGPIEGLLYSWMPDLIFAPIPLRRATERQFHNLLVIAITLFSFLLAWLLGSRGEVASWIGYIYGAFSVWVLFRRIPAGEAANAEIGLSGIVTLIVAGVLLPVLLRLLSHGSVETETGGGSINGQVAAMLIFALGASALFLRSSLQDLAPPPSISMACEQRTVNINAHPAQLTDEIDRELQSRWTERIPNRRYVSIAPHIDTASHSGRFEAEALEETQPMPIQLASPLSISETLVSPTTRWTSLLSGFGALLAIAACFAALAFARSALDPEAGMNWRPLSLAIGLVSVALYAFRGAQFLFGRFTFSSTLVWIEGKGNYQSARLDYGNTFQDRLKTAKDIINIENMTLRVWVAELDSTIFGKQGARHVVGMRGKQDEASYLADHLTQFAQSQSMVVAPTSSEDLKRAALLATMNQVGGKAEPANALLQAMGVLPSPEAQTEEASAPVPAPAAPAPRHCTNCGEKFEGTPRFCPGCGTATGL